MSAVVHKGWKLHYTIGDLVCGPVVVGDEIPMPERHGEHDTYVVLGGRPPHKPGSTGRVNVRSKLHGWEQEFYPSVVGAKWIEG